VDGRQLTAFEQILLGLICLAPASGYDLKRIFATTAMGVYQPSSGTLYPALRRLEHHGLIQAATGPGSTPVRRRRVLEPTPAGRAAHLDWLRTPVETATVARDIGLHIMRFVMMEQALPAGETLRFLRDLADALAEFTQGLEKAAGAGDPSRRHPALALNHGLAVHRASLQWVLETIACLEK
jgi:PadR family transcriptional regulator, regulatory protein AphA